MALSLPHRLLPWAGLSQHYFEGPHPPCGISNWDFFSVTSLETNFSPFDPVGEAKADIEILAMPEASQASTYFVELNQLGILYSMGMTMCLCVKHIKGLFPGTSKNKMVHHDKPLTFVRSLKNLCKPLTSWYWEQKAEITRENPHPNKAKPERASPRPTWNPDHPVPGPGT